MESSALTEIISSQTKPLQENIKEIEGGMSKLEKSLEGQADSIEENISSISRLSTNIEGKWLKI